MLALADFRNQYPEFADTSQYSDTLVTFWLTISISLVQADRWVDLTDLAVGLATAHQIAIANQAASGNGNNPGQVSGPVSAMAVGSVSVSNDVAAVTLTDAGFWNMTTYGIRFLQLARMFGAGPVQL